MSKRQKIFAVAGGVAILVIFAAAQQTNFTLTAANVVALFTGCSGTNYLGADGACHAPTVGTVTSVAGTANQIGSTGGATPVLSITSPLVLPGYLIADNGNKAVLTADWTCGTSGTVGSCASAVIIGSGGGVPLTFTLPLVAASYQLDCDLIVGQATAATANNWNLLTATTGATNVSAFFDMYTAATAKASGVTTGQASTTTTFAIGGAWTLGGTGTKMPVHIHAGIEGASASGTVVSLQLVAPTVGDVVTVYRGSACAVR